MYTVSTELGRWHWAQGLRNKLKRRNLGFSMLPYCTHDYSGSLLSQLLTQDFASIKKSPRSLHLSKIMRQQTGQAEKLTYGHHTRKWHGYYQGASVCGWPFPSHRHDAAILWRKCGQTGIHVQVWAGISFGRCVFWQVISRDNSKLLLP